MGERIKKLREQRKVSREWLAAMLKCDLISVECWEEGRMRPSREFIEKLSVFFKVSTDFIINGGDAV